MNLTRRASHLLLGVALLAAPALAQQPTPVAPTEATHDRFAEVPDAEKLRLSSQALKRMRQVLAEVFDKLKEARDTHDVVKAACVNESLTQIKALVRISEQADVAMQDALAKHDELAAD